MRRVQIAYQNTAPKPTRFTSCSIQWFLVTLQICICSAGREILLSCANHGIHRDDARGASSFRCQKNTAGSIPGAAKLDDMVQPSTRGTWVFALTTTRPHQTVCDAPVIHQNDCCAEANQDKSRRNIISVTRTSYNKHVHLASATHAACPAQACGQAYDGERSRMRSPYVRHVLRCVRRRAWAGAPAMCQACTQAYDGERGRVCLPCARHVLRRTAECGGRCAYHVPGNTDAACERAGVSVCKTKPRSVVR